MALAHAFDEAIFDRIDPGRIAAREASAARARMMWAFGVVALVLVLAALWMPMRSRRRKELLRSFDVDIVAEKVRNAAGRYVASERGYEDKVASLSSVRQRRLEVIQSLGEVAVLPDAVLPAIAEPAD